MNLAFWERVERDVAALIDAIDAPLPVAPAYRDGVIENLRVLGGHAMTVAAAVLDAPGSLSEEPFAP